MLNDDTKNKKKIREEGATSDFVHALFCAAFVIAVSAVIGFVFL